MRLSEINISEAKKYLDKDEMEHFNNLLRWYEYVDSCGNESLKQILHDSILKMLVEIENTKQYLNLNNLELKN